MLHVFGGEKRGAAEHVSVHTHSDSDCKHTIDAIVVGWVSDNGVLTTFSEVVLTVYLVVTAINGRRTSPDIDVVLAVVVVSDYRVFSLSLWCLICDF